MKNASRGRAIGALGASSALLDAVGPPPLLTNAAGGASAKSLIQRASIGQALVEKAAGGALLKHADLIAGSAAAKLSPSVMDMAGLTGIGKTIADVAMSPSMRASFADVAGVGSAVKTAAALMADYQSTGAFADLIAGSAAAKLSPSVMDMAEWLRHQTELLDWQPTSAPRLTVSRSPVLDPAQRMATVAYVYLFVLSVLIWAWAAHPRETELGLTVAGLSGVAWKVAQVVNQRLK